MATNKKKDTKTPKSKLGGTLSGIGDWCSEHWFLTFLMVGSALYTVRYVALTAAAKKTTDIDA